MFGLFNQNRPFDYPCIEPPHRFKPLREMNETEAQEYFEWFVGESDARRKLLLDMVKATSGNSLMCDYTPESLLLLWRATSPLFAKRDMTADERESLFQAAPAAARAIPLDLAELTTATGCLAIDIGFYLAEIFVRRHPKLHWTICKDMEGPMNEPILSGFRLYLVPYQLVTSCIWDQLDRPRDAWLYEAFQHWETKNILPEFK